MVHTYLHIENGKLETRQSSLTLADMQEKVGGGYIEGFLSLEGDLPRTSIYMYCNEDGISKGLAPNVRFSEVMTLAGWLLGPVLIVGTNEEGENRSLTPKEIGWFAVDKMELKYHTKEAA